MIALKILEMKQMMSCLLKRTSFDHFLLQECMIEMGYQFRIYGRKNKTFYSEEGSDLLKEECYIKWKEARPIAYEIIKGTKPPIFLKIVFCLSKSEIQTILFENSIDFSINDINGLFINLKYESNTLSLITGTSIKLFTLDKILEEAWDKAIKDYLKQNQITFEEL